MDGTGTKCGIFTTDGAFQFDERIARESNLTGLE